MRAFYILVIMPAAIYIIYRNIGKGCLIIGNSEGT